MRAAAVLGGLKLQGFAAAAGAALEAGSPPRTHRSGWLSLWVGVWYLWGFGWSVCARAVVGSPPVGAAAVRMVSPSMKALVDAIWAVWSIGVSIYDYIHTSAMEERIHNLESVITVHQCVIGLLTAGLVALFTYILLRKH